MDNISLLFRARIQDIKWILWQDYLASLNAIDCYYQLFLKWFTEKEWVESIEILEHAYNMARLIKNKEWEIVSFIHAFFDNNVIFV